MSGCPRTSTNPTDTPQATLPPYAACNKYVKAERPTLCKLAAGNMYVFGLPAGHDWKIGRHVVLSVNKRGLENPWPVAIAVVKKTWNDAAEVASLYERAVILDGAHVQAIARDVPAPLGKFVGHVTRIDGRKVLIDVGATQGVIVGETYTLRTGATDETSFGHIRITSVNNASAEAEIDNLHTDKQIGDGKVAPMVGQTVVYFQSIAESQRKAGRKILLVGLQRSAPKSDAEQNEGARFATHFVRELGNAAEKLGVELLFKPDLRVVTEGSDTTVHRKAQEIGKQNGANIVVWGLIQAETKARVSLAYTVVDSVKPYGTRMEALLLDRSDVGVVVSTDQVRGLVGAILMPVAFEAQQYAAVVQFLTAVTTPNALAGTDLLTAYYHGIYAEYVMGQLNTARKDANTLLILAVKESKGEPWVMLAHGELARLDQHEGKFDAARKHLEIIKAWSEKFNNAQYLAFALYRLGTVELEAGNYPKALDYHGQSLAIAQANKDRSSEAAAFYGLAQVNMRIDVSQAQSYLEKARVIQQAINEKHGEARTLATLAKLDLMNDRRKEARDGYAKSLNIMESIGDSQGKSVILHDLAALDVLDGKLPEATKEFEDLLKDAKDQNDAVQQANAEHYLGIIAYSLRDALKARGHFITARDTSVGAGDPTGEISSRMQIAQLDFFEGKRKEARAAIQEALKRAQTMGDLSLEANCLRFLTEFDLHEYKSMGVKAHGKAAWDLFTQLKMPRESEDVARMVVIMSAYEQAAVSWSAHAALLADGGILVNFIEPDGDFAKTGFRQGDILIRFGDVRLHGPAELMPLVEKLDPKQIVTIELLRGKEKHTLKVRGEQWSRDRLGVDAGVIPARPSWEP